jgi:hypothetical protein
MNRLRLRIDLSWADLFQEHGFGLDKSEEAKRKRERMSSIGLKIRQRKGGNGREKI